MICFILINYNAVDTTIACVENIQSLKIKEKKIIIVDNFSPNHSGEQLVEKYMNDESIKVILNSKNIGFAKANNLGYRIAKEYGPKFIVIMNNDMKIKTIDFEDALINSLNKYEFDVMGPDIYSVKFDYHQNPQRENNYSIKELKRMWYEYFLKNHLKFIFWVKWYLLSKFISFKEEKKKTLILSDNATYPLHGSFYVISEKYFKERGTFFYPKTFMYMESYILHYQMVKDKKKLIYDPTIHVDHYEDVSTDKSFKDGYKKAIFTNRCMQESCKAYIDLIEKGGNDF